MSNWKKLRARLFPAGLEVPELPEGESIVVDTTHLPRNRRQDVGRVVLTNRRLMVIRPVGSQLAIDGPLLTEVPLEHVSSFRGVPTAEGDRLFLAGRSPNIEIALRKGGMVYLDVGDPESWDYQAANQQLLTPQESANGTIPLLPTGGARRWLFTGGQIFYGLVALAPTPLGIALVDGHVILGFLAGAMVTAVALLPFPRVSLALWRLWGWSAINREPGPGQRAYW